MSDADSPNCNVCGASRLEKSRTCHIEVQRDFSAPAYLRRQRTGVHSWQGFGTVTAAISVLQLLQPLFDFLDTHQCSERRSTVSNKLCGGTENFGTLRSDANPRTPHVGTNVGPHGTCIAPGHYGALILHIGYNMVWSSVPQRLLHYWALWAIASHHWCDGHSATTPPWRLENAYLATLCRSGGVFSVHAHSYHLHSRMHARRLHLDSKKMFQTDIWTLIASRLPQKDEYR